MDTVLHKEAARSLTGSVTVLVVGSNEHDHACLRRIFDHSNWNLYRASDIEQALTFLQGNPVGVVLCDPCLPDGNWRSLLDSLEALSVKPVLLVASQGADSPLWAEVLSLGAYDVLCKPFDQAEVVRTISLAWLHWKDGLLR